VTFANPLPVWALAMAACAAAALAWHAYRRSTGPPLRRNALVLVRLVTLLLLVVLLMRPVARGTDDDVRDAVVAILVDTSRSMSIEDAGGQRRIDKARNMVTGELLPALGPRFTVEVLAFGDKTAPIAPGALSATARRSDLSGALTGLRERYRGRAVAGIVLLSDGGDTSGIGERAVGRGSTPPIYAIGIGSDKSGRDREVLSVTAAEAVLDDSRVDLAVTAVAHGSGRAPIELQLLENGRPIEVRRASPAAEGTPVHETFQVAPGRGAPTVYTVVIPAASGELVPENNARSALVQPPARAPRVLLFEGAPGFEHSFLKRAWATDSGIEVDSVVRKGRNEQGSDTFYIQAARSRAAALASGYPQKAEDLFRYDAVVLANVDGAQLSRSQLDATREFVARRGGGLLVLGARSFQRQGLLDTPLEEVIPLELTDRGGGALPASSGSAALNRVTLTGAGERHPMMQLGATRGDAQKRWDEVPALAAVAPLGGPRPGASVLALTSGAGGARRALVAVQRYGEGRAMIFAGEAAWRWRMMLPSTNRSYDTFWRQAVRWLAMPATDPIDITIAPGGALGDTLPVRVAVRNAAFEAERDAAVNVRVTAPDGRLHQLRAAPDTEAAGGGFFSAGFRPDQTGVYRVTAEARRGATTLGSAQAAVLVGGADLEMTDPRVNLPLLQRLALASGGRLAAEGEAAALAADLRGHVPHALLAVRRDLWHNAWSFGAIVLLLGTEWILRRRWGLR
jgi:uncharacterized membrane protein